MVNGIRIGDPRGFWGSVQVSEFDKYMKEAGGHIGQNVVEIIIKMKSENDWRVLFTP